MNSSLIRCLVTFVFCLVAAGRARGQVGATPQAAPAFACGACFTPSDSGAVDYIPLESTEVVLDVRPGLLEAEVVQTFTNRGDTALEAIYRYPLPPDATLTHFELRYRDRVITSFVREKRQARAAYEAAKAEGRKAALLERDAPTVFTTAVANFLPGETVHAVLRFIQPVEMWSDGLEVRFPMVTGQKYFPAGAQPGVDGNSAESPLHAIGPAWVAGHVYAFDVQVSGMPVGTIESPSHRISVQPRVDGSHLVALADEVTVPDRDFVLRVQTRTDRKPRPTWLTQHTATGDYGLLAVFPPGMVEGARGAAVRPRDILFLLDRSGSMQGTRFASAKEGLDLCLQKLRPEDRFQIVVYSTGHEFYESHWVTAKSAAVARARAWVAALETEGGTELQPALRDSLDFFERTRRDQVLILLTDGDVGDERTLVTLVERRRRAARVFPIGVGDAPNPYLVRKMAECGRGQPRFIANDGLVARELTDLFATLDVPALTEVRVSFLGDDGQVVPHMAFPESLPDTFHARPVQTVVRFADGLPGRVRIEGSQDGRPFVETIALVSEPVRGDGMEKLFGSRWVDDLDDMMRRAATPEEREMIRHELLDTALHFQLVTELTSRVAIARAPDPAAAAQAGPALPLVTVGVSQAPVADQGNRVDPNDPDIIVLSEFSVDAAGDTGYASGSTLTGTRLRTELRDLGAVIQVVTRDFLSDTGASTLEDVAAYMAEPVERPDVARAGSGSGLLDGLPIASIVDIGEVERMTVRSGATAWSDVDLRHASAAGRSTVALRVGSQEFASAAVAVSADPSHDGSLPIRASTAWNHEGHEASSLLLDAAKHWDATRLAGTVMRRDIEGYGDAVLADLSLRTNLGDSIVLEGGFARHDLRRDDPAQFHLDSNTNRQAGLGFLNLDRLTADTSRLQDSLAQVSAIGSGKFIGARHVMAVSFCWQREESDWLEVVPGAAFAGLRDSTRGGLDYQIRFLDDSVVVGLGLDRASHHTPGQTVPDQETGRQAVEASLRLVSWLDIFGSAGADEILTRVPTGQLRLVDDVLVPVAPAVEERDSWQAGLRLRFCGERVRAQLAWFQDVARDHAYRDWSWERDHAAGGPVWVDDVTLRLPVSSSLWPERVSEGWIGSLDLNPTRAFTAVATWHLGRSTDGPYRGGDRRASILARYEFQQGLLRRLSVGLGASYRDDLTFDDGYVLAGGGRWDAMLGYTLRWSGRRQTRIQLNWIDITDGEMQPTRFAIERGRRAVLSLTQDF